MVSRMSSPGGAGILDDRSSRGSAGRTRRDRPRRSGAGRPGLVLVELLDAVLALAVAVDEAEELRGERRVRSAALVWVDANGLGLERDRLDRAVRRRDPDPVGRRPVDAVGEDDVLLVGHHPLGQLIGGIALEAKDPDELGGDLLTALWTDERRHRCEALAIDGRGEDDDPTPVVDIAAPARHLGPGGRLGDGLLGEAVALGDLPVREPCDERRRDHDERDQQQEQSATRIGPSEHGGLSDQVWVNCRSGRPGRSAPPGRSAGRGRRRATACGSRARGRAGSGPRAAPACAAGGCRARRASR